MRRVVLGVTVAAWALAAVACGAGGGEDQTLPEGVLLLVREPSADEPAEIELYEPFEARIQVDPRVPTTNCALEVTLSVGDENGLYQELRVITFAAPLVGDVVRASFEFGMDPSLGSTTKEQAAEVPFDVPVWGSYFAQLRARLVPPAADDPTVALSSLQRCLETLSVPSADASSLVSDLYFEIVVVDDGAPVTTDEPDSATTEPADTTDSATTTTETTTTVAGAVSTVRPPSSTIRTTTTIRATTTTIRITTTVATTTTSTTATTVAPSTTEETIAPPPDGG